MKKRKRNLTTDLMFLTTVPLLTLGLIVLVVSSAVIYNGLRKEVRDSLEILVHSLYRRYEFLYPGEYMLIDHKLYKGETCLSEKEKEIDAMKEMNGMDITFFYGNTRYLTTIELEEGVRAVGTQADKRVEEAVLGLGESFFSDNARVNDIQYFAYYTPLYNHSGAVIGMLFAGETRENVMREVSRNVMIVCLIECVIMLLVITVTSFYSKKVVYAIEEIEKFLGGIARGDLTAKIDPYLLERQDEIGEMGRFSVMLQNSIVSLVGKDPLTGLPNRRSCDVVLESLMRKAEQKDTVFSIVMGDIDFFKKVNDTYGHQAGDEVLKMVAGFIEKHMEHTGFVFRWGGEEFLMVYEDMDREETGRSVRRLQEDIETARIFWNGKKIEVTMTFGVSDSLQEESIEKMISHADANLYIGKEEGRNRIVCL